MLLKMLINNKSIYLHITQSKGNTRHAPGPKIFKGYLGYMNKMKIKTKFSNKKYIVKMF